MTTCSICNESEIKYKCPKCSFPYCSLPCWKIHQSQCETVNDNNTTTFKGVKEPLNPPEPSPNVIYVNGRIPSLAEEALPSESLLESIVEDPSIKNLIESNAELLHIMKELVNLDREEEGSVPLKTLDAIQQQRLHNPSFEKLASMILEKYYAQK
ncbi:Zf-HIT protein Hit1 [Schizosaccharomyces pombe]|uniref:Uncharacterized zinc-finger protein C4F10.19c n=1 Tax=Schizosaccharomyces pombe (strain 972 / ATCC 24843) TaxID=284812 RepID=YEKJ_SCHPO|nr:putative HIT zinc finger domain-containing protein [Schizosaccharomyces pombe]O36031.1 RecName: Full=Uncharacterized zinc-finger protein C4F10.19c [Schizosaccharomyces pombe 972h-]CAB11725.1 zf-HIT protein Hit1 (predicted) [Schizosaccharomyces pombe]|eukprot:NP_594762.1 putative HIT zinc finger domain-containing protein [Schizosaccharomyces pombe]